MTVMFKYYLYFTIISNFQGLRGDLAEVTDSIGNAIESNLKQFLH